MIAAARFYVAWVAWWLRGEVRELWRALPGPAWVKCLIIGACLAIPGPQDELLLILVVSACRAIKRRRAARSFGV